MQIGDDHDDGAARRQVAHFDFRVDEARDARHVVADGFDTGRAGRVDQGVPRPDARIDLRAYSSLDVTWRDDARVLNDPSRSRLVDPLLHRHGSALEAPA